MTKLLFIIFRALQKLGYSDTFFRFLMSNVLVRPVKRANDILIKDKINLGLKIKSKNLNYDIQTYNTYYVSIIIRYYLCYKRSELCIKLEYFYILEDCGNAFD